MSGYKLTICYYKNSRQYQEGLISPEKSNDEYMDSESDDNNEGHNSVVNIKRENMK